MGFEFKLSIAKTHAVVHFRHWFSDCVVRPFMQLGIPAAFTLVLVLMWFNFAFWHTKLVSVETRLNVLEDRVAPASLSQNGEQARKAQRMKENQLLLEYQAISAALDDQEAATGSQGKHEGVIQLLVSGVQHTESATQDMFAQYEFDESHSNMPQEDDSAYPELYEVVSDDEGGSSGPVHRDDTHLVVLKRRSPRTDVVLVKIGKEDALEWGDSYKKKSRTRWVEASGDQPLWSGDKSKKKGWRGEGKVLSVDVWGERNTCSSAIMHAIKRNFVLDCDAVQEKLEGGCVRQGKPWLHGFIRETDAVKNQTNAPGVLNLLVTRDPYSWLESMARHPHYASIHAEMAKANGMEDFLTLEWASFTDVPSESFSSPAPSSSQHEPLGLTDDAFDTAKYKAALAQTRTTNVKTPLDSTRRGELLIDRDPISGQRFPSVAAMRTGKLWDWLIHADKFDHSGHVSCGEFMRDPVSVLQRLEKTYGLKRSSRQWNLRSCKAAHGECEVGHEEQFEWDSQEMQAMRKYYLRGGYLQKYTPDALDIANAFLDPEVEAKFGYKLFGSLIYAYEDVQHQGVAALSSSSSSMAQPEGSSFISLNMLIVVNVLLFVAVFGSLIISRREAQRRKATDEKSQV